MVLLEYHLSEISPHASHPVLESNKVKASLLLLRVKHGAHLEDLVSQTHLLKIAVDKGALSCVAALT